MKAPTASLGGGTTRWRSWRLSLPACRRRIPTLWARYFSSLLPVREAAAAP
ncbi:hypothetical protein ACFQU7_10880 [Pseudoroseomonas wenyumeiae]